MHKARVDPSRLIPLDPPNKEECPQLLKELEDNHLFQYLMQCLKLRYLKLLRDRQSNDRPELAAFNAGVATGADYMLGEIDLVFERMSKYETEES